jgi:molybdenum cofactor biosynthesis protein B
MKEAAASTPNAHKAYAPRSVGCFVLTISDTKTAETDTSGKLIRELLEAAGHRVAGTGIVRDEPTPGSSGRPPGIPTCRRSS